MTRVLGIDPGSRMTGFGIIDVASGRTRYVAAGSVCAQGASMPERLKVIFEGVRDLVLAHRPSEFAVEQVFMHRNAGAALKLGQARGAAICAAMTENLAVYEYTPRQIKQAIVGRGGAEKAQVQHMVKVLLGLKHALQEDAADALAVALCHSHMQATLARLPGVGGVRAGRWR